MSTASDGPQYEHLLLDHLFQHFELNTKLKKVRSDSVVENIYKLKTMVCMLRARTTLRKSCLSTSPKDPEDLR